MFSAYLVHADLYVSMASSGTAICFTLLNTLSLKILFPNDAGSVNGTITVLQ